MSWSDIHDEFTKKNPRLNTHKIVVLIDVFLALCTDKIEKEVREPIENISYESYSARMKEIIRKHNLDIDFDRIELKVEKQILAEKNQALKGAA